MIAPQDLCEVALAEPGGTDRIVIAETSSSASLRWARSMLTTNGEGRATTLTVVFIDGDRYASGTITAPDPEGARDLVRRLRIQCAGADRSPEALPLVAPTVGDDADWPSPAVTTDGSAFTGIAPQLGEWFADASIEHFGYAEHGLDTTWLATSTGMRRRHVQPHGRLEATAKSHERSRSAWWGCSLDHFDDVDLSTGSSALRNGLGWQSRRIDVPPGRHDVVLSPGAVGDLMVDLWWSTVAQDAIDGRSVFSRSQGGVRIGERVAHPAVTLLSDPSDREVPACPYAVVPVSSAYASVFDSGASLDRTDWIRDGVLTGLIGPRWTAGASGLPVHLSASTVRLEAGGTVAAEQLITGVSSGLLVTCLWYNRLVDPQTLLLTGLTRDGVYVIRDGEVVGAAGNFRFNDSPLGVLDRIVEAGASHRTQPREFGDYAHRVAMPALHVTDFNLSSPSDAL